MIDLQIIMVGGYNSPDVSMVDLVAENECSGPVIQYKHYDLSFPVIILWAL